uniref:Uncharacterized protein n=1 Tax=Candidatus Kentrum sp. FM TaxID=2126340 RepID=A0A450T5F2_9GAMM|nr:MAG: hypothetical protein BECKFM1743C_GA0114222_103041 [Candidatus Kentron sp. FM]VFJ61991.1 MAG: hypothetical protein BECKFM1743A_GA0114220_102971 [Candidatus Kentron sp. FM]VFK13726.1 MAG: hypothetical protein BECKFM1743B_GA0114221_102921 [Candidatus Kentron sp. FM]
MCIFYVNSKRISMSFLFLKIAFHSTKKAYTENSSILRLTCGTSDVNSAFSLPNFMTYRASLWDTI